MSRSRLISAIVLLGAIALVPHGAYAARISLQPEQMSVSVGDEFIIEVLLDTEDASINAVELEIQYPPLVAVKSISKAGSIIGVWVAEPSFTGRSVHLAGGVPGGTRTRRGVVARLVLQSRAAGQGSVTVGATSVAVLHDGSGTPAPLQVSPAGITVTGRPPDITPIAVASEPLGIADDRRPEKFMVRIGSDPGVFDGKYFSSFHTSDAESGIDHYEIREGDGVFRIGRSPYLLSDQSLSSVIRVRAYDTAGNWRQAVWPGFFKRTWWRIVDFLGF